MLYKRLKVLNHTLVQAQMQRVGKLCSFYYTHFARFLPCSRAMASHSTLQRVVLQRKIYLNTFCLVCTMQPRYGLPQHSAEGGETETGLNGQFCTQDMARLNPTVTQNSLVFVSIGLKKGAPVMGRVKVKKKKKKKDSSRVSWCEM